MDGFAGVYFQSYFLLALQECQGKWNGKETVSSELEPPKYLKFDIDSKIRQEIELAKIEKLDNCSELIATTRFFDEYGRSFMKKHEVHPDAYFQLAIQIAYYSIHLKPGSTYCTALTRKFYRGRTETVRSCIPEVIELASAIEAKSEVRFCF